MRRRLGGGLVRLRSLPGVSRLSLPGVLGTRAPRHRAPASRRRGRREAAARECVPGDRALARAGRRARNEIRPNARRGPTTREPAGRLAQGHDRSDLARGGARRARARRSRRPQRRPPRTRPTSSPRVSRTGGRPTRKMRTFSAPRRSVVLTSWFVSTEPSVPNLLRGRRVRRARFLHPLRTARNRPRATRSSFAPRGNDRDRGSRETRKRVKKEFESRVSHTRSRVFVGRRVSRVSTDVEPAHRRRCGFFFFLFSFFVFRASRAVALLPRLLHHYRSRRAATTPLRRRIGNPRAREASTPRRFTEGLVTTADGANDASVAKNARDERVTRRAAFSFASRREG